MLLYVAACTVTNGLAGRGTECILYVPRPLKVEQDPTPYYPDASKRAKETGEVILHFRIGVDGLAKSRSS
jgi:outer membrane biosynthesis protein TonB